MKLKQKPQDFRVRELLREGYLQNAGDHRVYKVGKIKATSIDAARELADMAGVKPSDVSMAGLKDRQGITDQFMSIPRGREVFISEASLRIESVGFAREAITSKDSDGNAFEVVSRGLEDSHLLHLRAAVDIVREFGYPNYFDEQRFGNLRHGQGWIALDLLRGETEEGLKRLLASVSRFEPPISKAFKEKVWRRWGDWRGLREVAGAYGKHHSVFDHLRKDPEDFVGAFGRVATRERVIHQFAFQSHLWNRALARFIKQGTPEEGRFSLPGIEGPLVFTKGPMPVKTGWMGRLPLPGARLEGLVDDHQRDLFDKILASYGIAPDGFVIPNVPGFGFKADERAMLIIPEEFRVRPSEPDRLNPGFKMVRFSFNLPRGAYASLLVKRLIGLMPDDEREVIHERGPRGDSMDGYGRGERGGRGRGRGSFHADGGGRGSYRSEGGGRGGYRSEGGGRGSYRSAGGGRGGYRSEGAGRGRGTYRSEDGGRGGYRSEGGGRGGYRSDGGGRGGYRSEGGGGRGGYRSGGGPRRGSSQGGRGGARPGQGSDQADFGDFEGGPRDDQGGAPRRFRGGGRGRGRGGPRR